MVAGSNPTTIVVTGANNVVETYTINIIRSLIENMVLKDPISILDFTFVSGQLTGQSVLVANGVGSCQVDGDAIADLVNINLH